MEQISHNYLGILGGIALLTAIGFLTVVRLWAFEDKIGFAIAVWTHRFALRMTYVSLVAYTGFYLISGVDPSIIIAALAHTLGIYHHRTMPLEEKIPVSRRERPAEAATKKSAWMCSGVAALMLISIFTVVFFNPGQ